MLSDTYRRNLNAACLTSDAVWQKMTWATILTDLLHCLRALIDVSEEHSGTERLNGLVTVHHRLTFRQVSASPSNIVLCVKLQRSSQHDGSYLISLCCFLCLLQCPQMFGFFRYTWPCFLGHKSLVA